MEVVRVINKADLHEIVSRGLIAITMTSKYRPSPAAAAGFSSSKAFNLFRILGDIMHLASIVILGAKMAKTRSCSGTPLLNH